MKKNYLLPSASVVSALLPGCTLSAGVSPFWLSYTEDGYWAGLPITTITMFSFSW